MAIKFLKQKQAQKKNLLLEHLHLQMYSQEPPRSQNQLHASHLTNQFCPRAQYLIETEKVGLKSKPIPTALRYTFDEGKDKQRRFNEDWMGGYHFGNWECRKCGFLAQACKKPGEEAAPCPSFLGVHDWRYEEIVAHHKKSNIIGSVDAILDLNPPDKMTVAELKIMKGDDFKALIAPLAEHKLRTLLYLYLIAHSNLVFRKNIDLSRAHILYMARGHGYKHPDHGISPFKDFVVERDDAAVLPYVNQGYCLRVAKKEKKLPARICSAINCTQASNCPVAKRCFSLPEGVLGWEGGNFPAGVERVNVKT